MKKELYGKIMLLSHEQKRDYCIMLDEILNDRRFSFLYGGMNNKDYASLPPEKVEIVEEKVYEEMFVSKPKFNASISNMIFWN